MGRMMHKTGRDNFGNDYVPEPPEHLTQENLNEPKVIKVNLDYKSDSKTGDVRIVQY